MVLIVQDYDTSSSTISRSAYFERSAKLASSFEEVVQNKYKRSKKYKLGKKTKTTIFTCNQLASC